MYYYFQKVGGDEPWVPIQVSQADQFERNIKPTFITVLKLDTLLDDKPTREMLEKTRYQGPFYMDLDDADDVGNSIEDAKTTVTALLGYGLLEDDIQVFLTGKKGLHILVPETVFMEKAQPVRQLPAIYKELAFRFATGTTDFKVYSARRGRMLRTCFNQRENGNWRVPVTVEELLSLDVDKYYELCGQPPREFPETVASFRPRMGILYDELAQKVLGVKRRKPQPVSIQMLKSHEPLVREVMEGHNLADVGFNKIAIQVCLFAREMRWTEDQLVEACKGLIDNHQSDGHRYNSPYKRERHLRDMFYYVEDNASYEYSLEPIKALLSRFQNRRRDVDEQGEVIESMLDAGVMHVGHSYFANRGDAGDVQITNFAFESASQLMMPDEGNITGIETRLSGAGNIVHHKKILLHPNNFTSSSALHNAVAPYGGSFTGSDTHARGLYQIMLKASSGSKYILSKEGICLLNVPGHADERLRKPFLVWSDAEGVRLPPHIEETGAQFTFQGWPDPKGVIETDLTKAESLTAYLQKEGSVDNVIGMFQDLLECTTPDVAGKVLGWMFACFWRQLFQHSYKKFPLLHVYGPAGAGKTEFTASFMKLFYCDGQPKITSPSSTPFAFLTLVGGSGSIPIILDEYKPGVMVREQLERYRSLFRDAYNMKDSQRGGGSRGKDSYNSLNHTELSAPIAFIAESMETETAIVERVVLVTLKRPAPLVAARNLAHFMRWCDRGDILSKIGSAVAARICRSVDVDGFKTEFDVLYTWAQDTHMLRADDHHRLATGEISQSEFTRRASNRPRNVFNNTVALYGLLKCKAMLIKIMGKDAFDKNFEEKFAIMELGIFDAMDAVTRSTVAEYIKVLTFFSDLTRVDNPDLKLEYNKDYVVYDRGNGSCIIVVAYRQAYAKYRAYMRWANSSPLYGSESSFHEGLCNSAEYVSTERMLGSVKTNCVVMDYSALVTAGMSEWFTPTKIESIPS